MEQVETLYKHVSPVNTPVHWPLADDSPMRTKGRFLSFAEALRGAMTRAGVESQAELARRSGITQATISRILSGETREPDYETMRRLAESLGQNVTDLHAGNVFSVRDSANPKDYKGVVGVPIFEWATLATVSPGNAPREAAPVGYSPGDRGKVGDRGFAVRVNTDAMASPGAKVDFPEGSIVLINPQLHPSPGQFVIVRTERAGTEIFRQWIVDGGRVFLSPLNPRYRAIELPPGAQVLGVAVQRTIDL